jgi:hypothetical protein
MMNTADAISFVKNGSKLRFGEKNGGFSGRKWYLFPSWLAN